MLVLAAVVSDTARRAIARSATAAWQGIPDPEGPPAPSNGADAPLPLGQGPRPHLDVEVVDARRTEADESPGGVGVGPLAFLHVTVRPDTLDEFEVLARVRNDGAALGYVHLTATILDGRGIAGLATTTVSSFARGEVRTLHFIGSYPFKRYDRVEFQIDDLEVSP